MNTIIDDGVELEIIWHGAKHLEYPQPRLATGADGDVPRHLTEEIRAYLSARPEQWIQIQNIRKALDVQAKDIWSRLRKLCESGEVEQERHMLYGHTQPVYRLRVAPVSHLPARIVKMRERLGKHPGRSRYR